MTILIIIVLVILVAAGIGAGIYILVFRASHKKEVLREAQANSVPNYNTIPGQETATGQQNNLGNLTAQGSQAQPTIPQSPVMNDIMGGAQSGFPGAQQVPEPSDAPSPQPDANFGVMSGSEINTVQANKPVIPENSLDLNQVGPQAETPNILDDNGTVGPVASLTENPGVNTDVDINDSTVPVTKETDSLEAIESEIGEAEANEGLEEREKEDGTFDPNDFQTNPAPMTQPLAEPSTPEIPVPPQPYTPADANIQSAPQEPEQAFPNPQVTDNPPNSPIADFPDTSTAPAEGNGPQQ